MAITTVITANGSETQRYRAVLSGASTNVATYTSGEKLYDVAVSDPSPYDTSSGWTWLYFPDIYIPAGGTLKMSIRNSTNAADLLYLTLAAGSITINGVAAGSGYTFSNRQAAMLGVHTSGATRWGVFDMTQIGLDAVAYVQSGIGPTLAGWSSTAVLGKVVQTVTLGTGGAAEVGGCILAKRFCFPLVDSFMSGSEAGMVPEQAGPTGVGAYFQCGQDCFSVPGCYEPGLFGRTDADCVFGPYLARRGGRFSLFAANELAGLANLPGNDAMLMMGLYNDTHLMVSIQTMLNTFSAFKAACTSYGIRPWFVPPYNITGEPDYLPYSAGVLANSFGVLVSDVMSHTSGTTLSDGTAVVKTDTVHPDQATAFAIARLIGSTFTSGSGAAGFGGAAALSGTTGIGTRWLRILRYPRTLR